jgi:hypothetical protein
MDVRGRGRQYNPRRVDLPTDLLLPGVDGYGRRAAAIRVAGAGCFGGSRQLGREGSSSMVGDVDRLGGRRPASAKAASAAKSSAANSRLCFILITSLCIFPYNTLYVPGILANSFYDRP